MPADHVRAGAFEGVEAQPRVIGKRAGVNVHPQNNFALRRADADVERRRNRAGWIFDRGNGEREFGGILRLSARADDDDFVGEAILRLQRFQEAGQAMLIVENGNDDGDGGHGFEKDREG